MDLQAGLDWGLALTQAIAAVRSPALTALMQGFTGLGDQKTYLLLVPLLFWCVELRLAIRLAMVFIASSYLNTVLKDVLMQPRPCDLAPVCIAPAEGFGLPSGHAQSAALVWGLLASQFRRGWFWLIAVLMVLLIGFSRVYLGVHFPTDVAAGWILGGAVLLAYLRWGQRLETWVRELGWQWQSLAAIVLGLPLFLIHPANDWAAAVAAFAGLGLGLALMKRHVPFSPAGPVRQLVLRFLLGTVIVFGLFISLRALLPAEGEPYYLAFRMLRYGAIGLWVTLGAPWLFLKLGLAPQPPGPRGSG